MVENDNYRTVNVHTQFWVQTTRVYRMNGMVCVYYELKQLQVRK